MVAAPLLPPGGRWRPEKAGSRGDPAGFAVLTWLVWQESSRSGAEHPPPEGRAPLMCRCGLWVQLPGGLSPRMHSPAQRTPGVLEQGIIPAVPAEEVRALVLMEGRMEGGEGGMEGWISRLMNL